MNEPARHLALGLVLVVVVVLLSPLLFDIAMPVIAH